MANGHKCTLCGGACRGGLDSSSLHLHLEIENLKQRLLERENHIVEMETNFLTEVDKYPNGEFAAMAEELATWQEKYSRLYEAHKRIQKVNQNLEDKLLKIVDKCETEKSSMLAEVAEMKQRLVDANATISCLKDENERNRNDVNTAIQLLQCKPSNFVPQKFESLPADLQQKVKIYMTNKKKSYEGATTGKHEIKTIKVPIPTFPPTAMFYSVNKSTSEEMVEDETDKPVDIVSAAIVAKILEEREKERQNIRHCNTCLCPSQRTACDAFVQTEGHIMVNLGDDIVRVESYQSPSPSVSSVTLIERSAILPHNPRPHYDSNVSSPVTLSNTRKNDVTKLNVGRNRYHSSKLGRGVNRRKERIELEAPTAKQSEIHIDDSGEVSCDLSNMRLGCEHVEIDIESPQLARRGNDSLTDVRVSARRCSVSIHPGSSNILVDNGTRYVPTASRATHSYAFVHSSRSSSTSSVEERPTETQI